MESDISIPPATNQNHCKYTLFSQFYVILPLKLLQHAPSLPLSFHLSPLTYGICT